MNRNRSHFHFIADRNFTAALMSIVPGFGQLYKGHYREGLAVILVDVAIGLWVVSLASLAYAAAQLFSLLGVARDAWMPALVGLPALCLGLLIPFLWWLWATLDAFSEPDLRKGHSHD